MKIFSPLCAGVLSLAVAAAAHGAEISNRKMAWAHYTPWHTPFNTSLTAINYYNFPLQDSTGSDLEDWKREFVLAKAQGIDGFFPDLVANKWGGTALYIDRSGIFEASDSLPAAGEGVNRSVFLSASLREFPGSNI